MFLHFYYYKVQSINVCTANCYILDWYLMDFITFVCFASFGFPVSDVTCFEENQEKINNNNLGSVEKEGWRLGR